jgi:WD40 repeat protein
MLLASTAESSLECFNYSSGSAIFKQNVEYDLSVFPEDKLWVAEPRIIFSVKFLRNEEFLTAHQDMAIRKFHREGGSISQNMLRRCHYDAVRHIEMFPDEGSFITTCQDGSARIWENFRPKFTLTGHSQIASCAVISPDSRRCFVSSYDQSVSIFALV